MKVLIVSSIFPPNIFGGAEIAAYNFACALVERGHEVHVLTSLEESETLNLEKTIEGFTIHRLQIQRSHTLFKRTHIKNKLTKLVWHLQDHFDPRNKKLLENLISKIQPSHISVHNISGFGFNTLPVIAKPPYKVSYFAHDLGLVCFNTAMFKNGSNCSKQCTSCRFVGAVRQYYFKRAKNIGLISPSIINLSNLKRHFKHIQKIPNITLHNISHSKDLHYGKKTNDIVELLYVGRLDPVKGITFLLEVLDTIAENFQFRLTVLGTGPLETVIREKYEGKKWIRIEGFVPSDKVKDYLLSSDLYCIPSLWAEAYGLTTALALKAGVPVIGSNIGGTTELVKNGKTGILIEPGNKTDWILCFTSLFKDKDRITQLKLEAKSHTQEFDDSVILSRFEKFISVI